MLLEGTVGEQITIKAVKDFLTANKGKPVTFEIASYGGSLSDGIAIHNLIKSHNAETRGIIISPSASAATIIHSGCSKRLINDNALYLAHNSMDEVYGNVYDMQDKISELSKNDKLIQSIYSQATGMEVENIINIMKAGEWLSAVEAMNLGFVDDVIITNKAIAAHINIENAKKQNINSDLIIKLTKKMNLFKTKVKAEGTQAADTPLEDGEFILQDGRTITVTGGVAVLKPEAAPADLIPVAELTDDAVNIIAEVVATETAKIEAKIQASFDAKFNEIKENGSTHKVAKGTVVASAKVEEVPVTKRIEKRLAEVRAAIVAKRNKV